MARRSGWLTRWLDGIEQIVQAGLAAELDIARPAPLASSGSGSQR